MNHKFIFSILLLITGTSSLSSKVVVLNEYRGWSNCIEISNAGTRVVISPQSGGRVLCYSVENENILFEDREFDGYLLENFRKDRHWPDGARFDIGPEAIPGKLRDELFMGVWDYKIINEYTVELSFSKDNMLGLHLKRTFTLNAHSSELYIKQSARNYTEKCLNRHFWGRYFCKGGGRVVLPLSDNEVWGYMGNYQSDKVLTNNGKLCYNVSDETLKLGCNSRSGWISYLYKDLKFEVTFKVMPQMDYSSTMGYTTIFYTNGKLCEIEPVSPLYKLSPGESFVFEQTWSLKKQ